MIKVVKNIIFVILMLQFFFITINLNQTKLYFTCLYHLIKYINTKQSFEYK